MLSMDLRNLALVPALAIRFGNDLRIGLSSGFLFSTGSLSFAEDLGNCSTASKDCSENAAAAARYNIDSGQGIGDAKFSVTLGGGIYWRHKNLEIGVSYQSHPLGGQVAGVEVAGDATTVRRRQERAAGSRPAPAASRAVAFSATSPTGFPDVFIAGATWHLRRGWSSTSWPAGSGPTSTTS